MDREKLENFIEKYVPNILLTQMEMGYFYDET